MNKIVVVLFFLLLFGGISFGLEWSEPIIVATECGHSAFGNARGILISNDTLLFVWKSNNEINYRYLISSTLSDVNSIPVEESLYIENVINGIKLSSNLVWIFSSGFYLDYDFGGFFAFCFNGESWRETISPHSYTNFAIPILFEDFDGNLCFFMEDTWFLSAPIEFGRWNGEEWTVEGIEVDGEYVRGSPLYVSVFEDSLILWYSNFNTFMSVTYKDSTWSSIETCYTGFPEYEDSGFYDCSVYKLYFIPRGSNIFFIGGKIYSEENDSLYAIILSHYPDTVIIDTLFRENPRIVPSAKCCFYENYLGDIYALFPSKSDSGYHYYIITQVEHSWTIIDTFYWYCSFSPQLTFEPGYSLPSYILWSDFFGDSVWLAIRETTEITEQKFDLKNDITIYPCPFENNFMIYGNYDSGKMQIDIYDLSGKKVNYRITLRSNKCIKLEFTQDKISSGIYLLVINYKNRTYIRKIIKIGI